jgi:hypothetical protein
MGCDIHMLVELFDYWWVGCEEGERQEWRVVIQEPAAYGTRNYCVFALLAGVRTYDNVAALAPSRGLPKDVSAEAATQSEAYGPDGHSHSWATLAEALAFDWGEHGREFRGWLESLTTAPTRLRYREPKNVRLVFWFDN